MTIGLSDKLEIHSNRNPRCCIESQIACLHSALYVDISEKINPLGNRLELALSPTIHKSGWLSTQTHTVSARCDPKVNIMCTVWMCYYVRMAGLLLGTCAHNSLEAVTMTSLWYRFTLPSSGRLIHTHFRTGNIVLSDFSTIAVRL